MIRKASAVIQKIIESDKELASKYVEFLRVLEKKFGSGSQMYNDSILTVNRRIVEGKYETGIPKAYQKYWKPYQSQGTLHHITVKQNVDHIKNEGLEPRDPFPRPWAGMKAIYMGEPGDPLYAGSENAVIEHVREKGGQPVLLVIKTKNSIYKSIEPKRTFQVLSLLPIPPEDIIEYREI